MLGKYRKMQGISRKKMVELPSGRKRCMVAATTSTAPQALHQALHTWAGSASSTGGDHAGGQRALSSTFFCFCCCVPVYTRDSPEETHDPGPPPRQSFFCFAMNCYSKSCYSIFDEKTFWLFWYVWCPATLIRKYSEDKTTRYSKLFKSCVFLILLLWVKDLALVDLKHRFCA